MKKKILISMILITFVAWTWIGSMASTRIRVYVDGKELEMDTEAIVDANNRTLVPIKYIAEAFGATVKWDANSRSVFITNDSKSVASSTDGTETANNDENLGLTYPIVDTSTTVFYSDIAIISKPNTGQPFYGQDAQYNINPPSYSDNGDGTVTDLVTGLMWQQTLGEKMTLEEANALAEKSTVGGYTDWRIPNIKELYSLIQFDGIVKGEKAVELFIDTDYFEQPLGNTSLGEREIDAQTWSSTVYVGETMSRDETIFGVNFIDGRIKGYPKYKPQSGEANTMYFRMVRGNEAYGENRFVDNKDGTISDLATGLMWQQSDDGIARDWEASLSYAESLNQSGYDDWRLPNAKELQSIVDYNKSLQTTGTAAINSLFSTSKIMDPEGIVNYPFFWTSTTHLDGANPYSSAVYIAFGEAQGMMNGQVMDVHGAGAQRSDPKSGDESDYPTYFGPQGDVRYVYNYVRCVRTIN